MPEPDKGLILVLGCEPAAFSCAFALLNSGLVVHHIYPVPFGLCGASRDIGFTYPEIGEPWERLAHALGSDLAREYYTWSRAGIEDLNARIPGLVQRGSRLALTRTETEAKLVADDALVRGKPPIEAQVRLMSGAAASNYAPVDGANQASFETHALAFAPVKALDSLSQQLQSQSSYHAHPLKMEEWKEIQVSVKPDEVSVELPDGPLPADVVVVAAGLETGRLLSKFDSVLVPYVAQAFRSPPLKEKTRSSVVGLSASWGYERYRFDEERRLLGCGIDPSQGGGVGVAEVDEKRMTAFLKRAGQMFTDFDGQTDGLTQWAVQVDGTCDGLPILGPLTGEPRVHVAAGFFISAWSRGWEAGTQVGRAISGQPEGQDILQRCSVTRFR